MRFREIGNATIPRPLGQMLFYKDGNTGDIATKVLKVYGQQQHQVAAFAQYLKGATLYETCRNIWQAVKDNIRYQIDPKNNQWVRRPAQMWWAGVGDCKSYSVFIASCLSALGIVGCFRFVSYDPNDSTPTHVYVVVKNNGSEIILDAVLPGFNEEKQYTDKFDYNMTRIYELAGTGKAPTIYTKEMLRNSRANNNAIAGGLSTLLNKEGRRKVLADSIQGLAMLALYQFIPAGNHEWAKDMPWLASSDNLLASMPEVVKQKRQTSFQSFWDIGSWADLKVERDVFPQLKTILTQQLGMDPMEWWRRTIGACAGQTAISRIGVIDPATAMAAAGEAQSMLSKVKSVVGNLFGGTDLKWKRGDPSVWGPSNDDWSSWPCKPLAYLQPGPGSPNTGSGFVSWNDIMRPPAVTPPPVTPTPQPYTPTPANTDQPPQPAPTGSDNNNMLLLGGAALAAVLLLRGR